MRHRGADKQAADKQADERGLMNTPLRARAGARPSIALGAGGRTRRLTSGARLLAAVGALACAVPGAAPAQQPPVSAEEAKRRLDANKTKLEQTQRIKKELQSDVDKLSSERERINARLVETGKLIQQTESQLSLIEGRLGEFERQEKSLREQLQAKNGSISGLLAVMQRMGRNPPPVMVTRREDALGMVRSAMLLASAFPELRSEAVALGTQLDDLVRVMASIRSEGEKLRAETVRLDDARARLSALQETKRQTQSEREAELNKMGDLAQQISKNVQDLSELIGNLDKEVSNRTTLGAYEKELAALPPGAASPPPPVDAASTPTPPPAAAPKAPAPAKAESKAEPKPPPPAAREDRGVVLAPSGDTVAMASPGRIKPAMPFQDAKGLLAMPASGKRVLNFGDKTQYGSQSKGLVVQTRQGAQIVSPSDGWVVYAGDFRSYGQLLIINAGGGYHILLAGLSQIDVQLGQFVLTGEPVGVMPNAGASAKSQDNAPVLYIEFRKDQKPVDPEPWWVPSSRKVK